MNKLAIGLAVIALAGAAASWVLTGPNPLSLEDVAALPAGEAQQGEIVFWAAGCASCHAAPGAKGEDKLVLAGGLRLTTPFGTFVAPNVSSHGEDGIGNWSAQDFANAMLRGVSPDGGHYYPAFPYASYVRMTGQDVSDLFEFMKTLPAVAGAAPGHELAFPFSIRRGLGFWKWMNVSDDPVVSAPENAAGIDTNAWQLGRYLVEGAGHCGECHTPRDSLGGLDKSRWLAGAPAAAGDGRVPGLDPSSDLGNWSAADIAYYLESGFTPEYDSVGGEMVSVQENMARLPASYRQAIAIYLKTLPAAAAD